MGTLKLSLSRLAATALLALPLSAFGSGTVVTLDGSATIKHRGKSMPAEVASELVAGDTLSTDKHSKAQLRFEDDSVFAVVGESDFKVEQFATPRAATPGNAIFSLLRGGFRTITGLIGKGKNDTYQVRTAVATIGVRGSAYASVICAGQCPKQFKDGLYVKAERGVITVANAAGKIELRAGQGGYAESAVKAPIKVKLTPFDIPGFAADFSIDIEFETEIEPPRIEPEPPASPSTPP